ncbi:MAG TPA: hypothetical protein VLD59_03400 [Steroidobacteraceae bacterium]|nr:hypothetical protein [Steroidobacteraceae bacterium]
MNTAAEALPAQHSKPIRAIVSGGLIAGTFDLIYAFVWYGPRGVNPLRIMQSIASGLLGKAAYEGGAMSAALGGLLHYFILIVAAALYFAASRRLAILTRQPIVCGLLFGIAIWIVMNLVVVPLSAFPHEVTHTLSSATPHIIAHMVLVGLPIALAIRYVK